MKDLKRYKSLLGKIFGYPFRQGPTLHLLRIDKLVDEQSILAEEERRRKERNHKVLDICEKYIGYDNINSIIDVGCGHGEMLRMIMEKSRKKIDFYGVDICESLLDKARQLGVKVNNIDINRDNLPYPDGKFDFALASEIIEHLYNPDFFLMEIYRVLHSQGILALSTPNLTCWRNRILLMMGHTPTTLDISLTQPMDIFPISHKFPNGHIRNYTLEGICKILYLYNFNIVGIYGLYISTGIKIVELLDKFFSKIPSLSTYILILARKR
jgi:methionine biosynthesis protein MetW